jgi:hypothetical protein
VFRHTLFIVTLALAVPLSAIATPPVPAQQVSADHDLLIVMSDTRVLAEMNSMVTRGHGLLDKVNRTPISSTQSLYRFEFKWNAAHLPGPVVEEEVGWFDVTVNNAPPYGIPTVVKVAHRVIYDE